MHHPYMPYKANGQSNTALQFVPSSATFSSTRRLINIILSVICLQEPEQEGRAQRK